VLIDAAGLTFIDSTGLSFIAQLAAAGQTLGCPPVIAGASRRIRESITLAGLGAVVDHQDDTASRKATTPSRR
jgi:anti-anti-sigma regulatory factor